jgi:hypothetical protein
MSAAGERLKDSSSPTQKRLSFCGVAVFSTFLIFQVSYSAQITTERGVGGIVPSAAVTYRDSWAVIIGINRYTKASRLNYAVNDANSVVAAVQQLGFPSDKILLLLDRDATKQRIEQILYGTLRRTTPEDRVLVFFAGHGMTASLPRGGEEGFLLPVDGDPEDLPLTAVAMEDIRKIARRIPAKHILIAVDACYSGFTISRDVTVPRVDDRYLESVTKEPAVQIITAGRKGEQVLEEDGHGLFTRRLLHGLTGPADTDQNGIVTAQELATWLESRVVRDSQDQQHPQYSRLDGEGQFVFLMPGGQQFSALGAADLPARLAGEAEQLKRERALFEEERRLYQESRKIELAQLQAERILLRAETERARTEIADAKAVSQELEGRRKAEGAARDELAKLEAETARLLGDEARLAKEKDRVEAERLETERRRKAEDAIKAAQPQAIAKVTQPTALTRPVALPTAAPLPKYNAGDSWTVKFDDGRTQTRKVRGIEKDEYVFEWGLDLVRYYDQQLVLRKQITPEDGKEFPSYLLKQQAIEFPLSVNKAWEFRILVGTGGTVVIGRSSRIWRVYSSKVLGSETIQTSAGTFGTFKIEENSYEIQCGGLPTCDSIPNSTIIRHWWYAPEVRFPVKVAHVRGTYLETYEEDYELIAFDLK